MKIDFTFFRLALLRHMPLKARVEKKTSLSRTSKKRTACVAKACVEKLAKPKRTAHVAKARMAYFSCQVECRGGEMSVCRHIPRCYSAQKHFKAVVCEYEGPATMAGNGANTLSGRGAGNRENVPWNRAERPQAPVRMRNCVAMRSPTCVSPPATPTGPTEGYFACPNPATTVPDTISLQVVHPGPHFCAFPPHLPGTRLRPFSLLGLGLEGLGYLLKCVYFEIAHGNAPCTRGLSPGLPSLDFDLDIFSLVARALATCAFLFVLRFA